MPGSWASSQIDRVVAAGLLADAAARPDEPVTHGELFDAIAALGLRVKAPVDRARPVTIRELDARLVGALGLSPSARRIRLAALGAGLAPPAWLGTETVARIIGLRFNHPFGQDDLERGLDEPASRAEAAYSLARAMSLDPGSVQWVEGLSSAFALPALSDWQRAVVSRAVQLVGSPYVWTGTSERAQLQWTAGGTSQQTVPGGFDCSGFVWRVYKLRPFAGAPETLGGALKGRTTYEMSAEVPVSQRVPLADLQAGDLIFFGSRGPTSKPAEIGHMGIYAGGGWFVHSSSGGVTLQPLDGWYSTRFAWGRRPLAEAGLAV